MEFLNTIWIFFQDQILGMKFLNLLIGDVLSVAGVDTVSYTHLDVYKRQNRGWKRKVYPEGNPGIE